MKLFTVTILAALALSSQAFADESYPRIDRQWMSEVDPATADGICSEIATKIIRFMKEMEGGKTADDLLQELAGNSQNIPDGSLKADIERHARINESLIKNIWYNRSHGTYQNMTDQQISRDTDTWCKSEYRKVNAKAAVPVYRKAVSDEPCARTIATNVVNARCARARYLGQEDYVWFDDVDKTGQVVRRSGTYQEAAKVAKDKRKVAILARAQQAQDEYKGIYDNLSANKCNNFFDGYCEKGSQERADFERKTHEVQKELMKKYNVKVWSVE